MFCKRVGGRGRGQQWCLLNMARNVKVDHHILRSEGKAKTCPTAFWFLRFLITRLLLGIWQALSATSATKKGLVPGDGAVPRVLLYLGRICIWSLCSCLVCPVPCSSFTLDFIIFSSSFTPPNLVLVVAYSLSHLSFFLFYFLIFKIIYIHFLISLTCICMYLYISLSLSLFSLRFGVQ